MLPVAFRCLMTEQSHDAAVESLKGCIELTVGAEGQGRSNAVRCGSNTCSILIAWIFAKRVGVHVRNMISLQRVLDRNFPIHRVLGIPSQRQRPSITESLAEQLMKIFAQELANRFRIRRETHEDQLAYRLQCVPWQAGPRFVEGHEILRLRNAARVAIALIFPTMILTLHRLRIARTFRSDQCVAMSANILKAH